MADKGYKVFIVEGEAREPQIIDNISKVFFSHDNVKIITLPAGENIYMLWKKLKEDDFNTHQTNLGKEDDTDVVARMLKSFDNETENGKLYISYPMVEALRDYRPGVCGDKEICYVAIEDMKEYRNTSSERSTNPQFKRYNYEIWKDIIDVFAGRVSCLFGLVDILEYEKYSETAGPYDIYVLEEKETQNDRVFVLSAFPEFLVDYFGVKLWRTCVKHKKNRRDSRGC